MKQSKIILVLLIFNLILVSVKAQGFFPYNKGLPSLKNAENVVLPHIDSLKALFVEFNSDSVSLFKQTIKNNPQLVELQLKNPPQAAIQIVSELNHKHLTHFFIHAYRGANLKVFDFPNIEFFSLESTKLEFLSMHSNFQALNILAINSPNLKEWQTDSNFPSLGLIDLKAVKLSAFPIKELPGIEQFSFECSFDTIPNYLCKCKKLRLISFNNHKLIPIDECFERKIKKGDYSNLTLYEGINGKEVLNILSKDRRKE